MTTDAGAADRVWRAMRGLVLERYDRRKEVCAALDMSFIRAKALRQLAHGSMTMRELAGALATDAPYTTLVVDDLERRGLATRGVHPGDRRRKVVTATAEGVRAAAKADAILNVPPPPVLELTEDELATLDRILAKLLAAAG